MVVWHVVVMMDIKISCKGHCEKLSHFLDHVSHTEVSFESRATSSNLGASVLFTFSPSICMTTVFIASSFFLENTQNSVFSTLIFLLHSLMCLRSVSRDYASK